MDTKNGNAIELIEGSPAIVNMTASANPLPIEYEWSKESSALELEKLFPTERLSLSGGVLNLTNVKRQDSGYYTISATNAEGTTQTKIKIDVLYAPRLVTSKSLSTIFSGIRIKRQSYMLGFGIQKRGHLGIKMAREKNHVDSICRFIRMKYPWFFERLAKYLNKQIIGR